MKTSLDKYKALRGKFSISVDRAAEAISKTCGRNILSSKVERFERGAQPRSGAECNAIIAFYQSLEKGICPPNVSDKSYTNRGRGRPPKTSSKVDALEALLTPKIHVKRDGEFLSTSIAGEGISFFPEGQYLLQIDSKGAKIYSLSKDSNPMAASVESLQAELAKYKEGYENWMSLKDLIKD